MINFRYHIVSITAVFLALAIGTALGSTFLDGPTVDLLNRNISNAEDRIAAANEENDRLSDINDAAREREESLLLEASPRLFSTMLVDRPTLVLVAPGVDPGESSAVVEALTASGTDLRGVVDLKDELLFTDDIDEDLAAALGLDVSERSELRSTVYAQLVEALAAAGAEPPTEPESDSESEGQAEDEVEGDAGPADDETGAPNDSVAPDAEDTQSSPVTEPDDEADQTEDVDGTEGDGGPGADEGDPGVEPEEPTLDGTQPEIITILEEAGYISVDRLDGEPRPILEMPGYRYVLVTGHQITAAQRQAGLDLLSVEADQTPLPLVVVSTAQAEDEGEDEGESLVQIIRDDDVMQGRYSTVDNVDRFSGAAAMVLLLEDLGTTNPGHYGQGPGAQAVLPAVP